VKAIEIIQDAFERCNRLSPGETLGADDVALGMRRLNLLVDELSGQNIYLFLNTLTSNPQSGHITLGIGAWASVPQGEEVISATADNMAMLPITMKQFNELYQPTSTGRPTVWAQDGLGTVYLWPVPTGHTIKIQTRGTVAEFVDETTDYIAPAGYKSALGAALAVRIAPNVLGAVPAALEKAERDLMGNISKYSPQIIHTSSYTGNRGYFPPRLF
jgi:hypothetical protein